MRPLKIEDLLKLSEYRLKRDTYAQEIIKIKEQRRISLGNNVSMLFENRDTLLYQVQEMVYIENIQNKEGIRHELYTYNQILAHLNELTATMLIEFADAVERKYKLKELLGLEQSIILELKHEGQVYKVSADYDQRQISEEKISSVQFLRFKLREEEADAFLQENSLVSLISTHPLYSYTALLNPGQKEALCSDLRSSLQ